MIEREGFPDITKSRKDPYKHVSRIKHYVVFHIMEMAICILAAKIPKSQVKLSTFLVMLLKKVVREESELVMG